MPRHPPHTESIINEDYYKLYNNYLHKNKVMWLYAAPIENSTGITDGWMVAGKSMEKI